MADVVSHSLKSGEIKRSALVPFVIRSTAADDMTVGNEMKSSGKGKGCFVSTNVFILFF